MLITILLMVVSIAIGVVTGERHYYIVSILLMMLSISLLVKSVGRKLKVREVVLISSLTAIAVVGRVAFYWLPQFKPVTAIVIVSAVALGSEGGMLVGMLSAFISNFVFSQGPWTPFQMFAWGLIGLITGKLFFNRPLNKYVLMVYGFIVTMIVYGGILNLSSALTYGSVLNVDTILSYYATGVPFDLVHAVSTAIFLYCITNPLMEKLQRIRVKFGMLQ